MQPIKRRAALTLDLTMRWSECVTVAASCDELCVGYIHTCLLAEFKITAHVWLVRSSLVILFMPDSIGWYSQLLCMTCTGSVYSSFTLNYCY